MTLDELAAAAPQAEPLAVPAWTLGCFRRRCISYADGTEDGATQVIWIQSHGLTGDIRIPAWRPGVSGRAGWGDVPAEDLPAFASVEGGVAYTRWSDGLMHWDNWSAFQPYDKWPEPGRLERVGNSLIEWAPSGVYVEDWRLQPGSGGLLVGLRLESETGADGVAQQRDGGLVISGEHALITLGRREELVAGAPVQSQLKPEPEWIDRVFDAETSYVRRQADRRYRIALSTNPFREGLEVSLDHFSFAGPGRLLQKLPGFSRLWRIDTLLPDVAVSMSTSMSASGADWLAREAATLKRV